MARDVMTIRLHLRRIRDRGRVDLVGVALSSAGTGCRFVCAGASPQCEGDRPAAQWHKIVRPESPPSATALSSTVTPSSRRGVPIDTSPATSARFAVRRDIRNPPRLRPRRVPSPRLVLAYAGS